MKSSIVQTTIFAFSIALLSACGGGGSSTTTTPVPTPPVDTNPEPVTLTVTAVDGYLENARVFIDLNDNYMFDEAEPHAMTDAAGQVTFTLTDIVQGLLKPIIVEAIEGQTIDKSSGLTVAQSYTMVAPPASEVVSPLTTLAQLSLVQNGLADVDAAVAEIKTQLALPTDANILADYLSTDGGNETLYAIARSIVPYLPADATTLFAQGANQNRINTLMARSGAIATAVQDAIAAGATPGSLFLALQENGEFTATELTMEHALAFVDDVQVWSDAMTFEFIQSASDFRYKIKAAAQAVSGDTSDLLTMLAQYSEGGLIALKAEIYREFDAGLFVSGSTGTVTTSFNNETQTGMLVIDAQLEDKTVSATITLSNEDDKKATLTADLESDEVMITVEQGSELQLDGETYVPEKMALMVKIDAKPQNVEVDLAHFSGELVYDTVELVKSDGSTIIAPVKIAVSGLFEVDNQESFNAAAYAVMTPKLNDDVLSIDEVLITLQLDADFTEVPNAYIKLDVGYTLASNQFRLTLGYGEREVTLNIAGTEDVTEVVLTNAQGMTLTLDLTLQQNAENRGVLVMGIEQVATISSVDGQYVITFNDGTTKTLF